MSLNILIGKMGFKRGLERVVWEVSKWPVLCLEHGKCSTKTWVTVRAWAGPLVGVADASLTRSFSSG